MENFIRLIDYKNFFLVGLGMTVVFSIIGIILGFIIGTTVCFMRLSNSKIFSTIAKVYIDLIRKTPILVQLWIVYLIIDTSKNLAGIVALSINSGAYVAEIIRSGIMSIPKGQMEAARSLGMNKKMAMRYIILPQAIKNIIPVIGNEFIAIVKESAIVSVIGATDLSFQMTKVRGATYLGMEPLMVVFVLYFILISILTKAVNLVERRLSVSDRDKRS